MGECSYTPLNALLSRITRTQYRASRLLSLMNASHRLLLPDRQRYFVGVAAFFSFDFSGPQQGKIRSNRRTVAGVRTVTFEAECLAPTLRASVPTEALGLFFRSWKRSVPSAVADGCAAFRRLR